MKRTNEIAVYKRDYMIDVLGKRDVAVNINWTTLNNSIMIDLGYESVEMENFSDLFEIVDGKLKGETYLKQVIRLYLTPDLLLENATKSIRNIVNNLNLRDDKAATIIFTPAEKAKQEKMKELIEKVVGTDAFLVRVLNGDETTSYEAEDLAKEAIADAKGKQVVFVAGNLVNRSFSVPEIKNVLFLINGACAASVAQKVARGFTPWNSDHQLCRVVDFRLNYNSELPLDSFMSMMACDTLLDTANQDVEEVLNQIEEMKAHDKLHFFEYISNGQNPFKELTRDELNTMMRSSTYNKELAYKVVFEDITSIELPKINIDYTVETLNLISTNVKGDATKMKTSSTKAAASLEAAKEKEDIYEDQRIKHLAFLLDNYQFFNSYSFDTADWLYREFTENMSGYRLVICETLYNVDMNCLTSIVNLLHEKHINL